MVGEACLPNNAYYPRTPDYTLCSGVHVCWSEHSDSSFVYGFMILDYGFGTMTATTCNEESAFFTSDVYNNHNLWSCQKVCDALVYLLDNIFIRFGTKLYRQSIGIPMGTNCAPLVADLFLFCYERDFMKSLSRESQADIIEAFNSTSRYLDDLIIKY